MTKSWEMLESVIFSTALDDSMPCVTIAITEVAPASSRCLAASANVPQVSA